MSSIEDKLNIIAENEQKVYDKGYSDGKNAFEKIFTANYTRTRYNSAFQYADMGDYIFSQTLRPSGNIEKMFYSYAGKALPKNVSFDGIQRTQTSYHDLVFGSSVALEEVYDIKFPVLPEYNRTFYNCPALKSIERLPCSEKTVFDKTFYNCASLTNINFDGIIGQDLDLSHSPYLSQSCLLGIKNKLKNYKGTDEAGTHTLKLHEKACRRLDDYEYDLEFSYNCWTDYIVFELCWNLESVLDD